tara:strand:+ start:128 stop:367 length:240 start_codon:yes stop_codon:yes gene_type:complete
MLGAIAEGGGEVILVVEVKLESTLDSVVLFVSIQLLFVELSQPSSAKTIGTITDKYSRAKKPHIKNNKTFFMLFLTGKR